MPQLDRLPEQQRQLLRNRPVQINDTGPVTPPRAALRDSRLALVTTAGLQLSSDRPFERDDPSYRVIPSSSGPSEVLQSHSSIGFDRTAIQRDLDVVFPLELLREFEQQGAIGELAPRFLSFMGAQRDPEQSMAGSGARAAEELRGDGVDVVLLTPT